MPKLRPRGKLPRPTDAELEILRVLWRFGPSTVRRVHEEITSGRKNTIFNTTLKLMNIMYEKGLLKRQDIRRPFVYQSVLAEERMQQRLVADLLDRAFGGAAHRLVAALTASKISKDEMAKIRRLLSQHGNEPDERAE